MMLFTRLLAIIWVLGIVSGQPTLPADEVESLWLIARTLRKSDWDFSVNPCSGSSGWVTPEPVKGYENSLTCDCTFLNNTICHVVSMRISDLSGNDSNFPNLRNIRRLVTLILRSCNIAGELPPYIGGMNHEEKLKVLDLSFNKLSGPIPESFYDIRETDYIYLTGNSLSGLVPDWILNYAENVDLSYNNFTPPSSSVCQPRNLNLFASSKGNTSGIVSCLRSSRCEREYYSLHINCGGGEVADGKGTIYEDDAEAGGPSTFVSRETNWGFSSTGHFLNNDNPRPSFVWQNSSVISGDNPLLYADARLSPLSLTYYGFCLRNMNYTVNLYFAEIFLTDDGTYFSVGRRLFDVYIQGKRVLKDFNIESEAGGVNKGIRKSFTAVVTDTTLYIRFYWAGKGTDGIPRRGVYGPLISAISVDSEKGDCRISKGAVVGIVLGVAFMFLLVLSVLWWKGCQRHKDEVHNGATGIGAVICFVKRRGFPTSAEKKSNYRAVETFLLQHGLLALKRYKYSEIKKMTKSFSHKLGQGGYGSVYKGDLPNGALVAVKVLSAIDENVEDFINEVASISRTSHVNIVNLLGFCFDWKKRALVYEYMPNKSLDKYISKSGSAGTNCCLDLEILYKIAVGVAEGLDYLHRGCNTRIVHFDIKPQNILLDEEFCPKISDFGLAKLCKKKQSLLSMLGTRGTVGYIAPEVFSRNYGGVSHKSDVYSYGMMVLEMVGANMVAHHTNETTQSIESYFPDKIYERALDKTRQLDGLTIEVKEEIVTKMLLIGFWCIQTNPLDRPSISKVVEMLEGSLESIQIPPKPVLFTPTLPVWGASSISSYVGTEPSAEGVTHTHFEVSVKG